MGTTRGLIFETEISTESTMFSSAGIEKQWKQLYDLGKGGQSSAITGLEYHRVPNSKRFFIFVTTNSRLYQFQVSKYLPNIGLLKTRRAKDVAANILLQFLSASKL